MLINRVCPQVIIISCLKCFLISYKQVQVVQVLPIDPLKNPDVRRPLSSHTELKKTLVKINISDCDTESAKVYTSNSSSLKRRQSVRNRWSKSDTQYHSTGKYNIAIDEFVSRSCFEEIWDLNTSILLSTYILKGHYPVPVLMTSVDSITDILLRDWTKHFILFQQLCVLSALLWYDLIYH